jgi:immune inhibitor A
VNGECRKRGIFIRTVLSFLFLFLIVQLTYGAPASKKIQVLQQSDGSFFLAQQCGDERTNGWQTIFGYTILYDKDTGNWVYADKDAEGKLVKTTHVVVKDLPPSSIKKNLRPTPPPQRHIGYGGRAPGPGGGDEEIDDFLPSASYPKIGIVSVPVILIDFDDADTTYSDTDLHDVIFGDTSDTSVRHYFEEVSYDTFTFFEDANWDTYLVDWVQADSPHNDYGHAEGNDEAARLVKEAVEKADIAGFNFSPFDNNNDGYVDGVIVIHQGRGAEESGQDTDIWSHTWSLSEAPGVDTVLLDGVTIDTYIIVPETIGDDTGIITIGVFCHEFGHVLGLPELYDITGYSYGIGDWGTMGYGLWNGVPIGSSPAHFCAWSKWFLGWVTPTQITDEGWPDDKTTIKAVEDYDTGIYQFLDNPNGVDYSDTGEYFLLENRQHVGFDSDLPGTGLLIWHIDESRANNSTDLTNPHKLVDLEEADRDEDLDDKDNKGDEGDPYPGTENNTAFNFQSDPDNEFYRDYDDSNEQSSEARVEDIELSDTDILAYLFINEAPQLDSPLLTPDEGDTTTFFTYKIDYQDDDGDTPGFLPLIIDEDEGHPKYMGWESGSGIEPNGTYSTIISGLSAGEHNYYFYFEDGEGGVARMPPSGTYPGPTVSGGEEQQQTQDDDEEGDDRDVSLVQWDCFIATASYGTPMAKEVGILCQFRDRYLITTPLGEKFVMLYYRTSPPIADFISKHSLLRKCVRLMLKPIVKIAKKTLSPQEN